MRMIKDKKGLLLIYLLIIIAAQVHAGTVYYVDRNSGNDSNDGLTLGAAWKTISKANNTLRAGDTVYIRAGIYIENDNDFAINPKNSGSPENYIKYQNYNGERVVITGCSQPITCHEGSNYIWIEGIEVDGSAEATNHMVVGVRIGSSYNVIKGCSIHHSITDNGAERGVWIENNTSHNQLLGNYIHHIGLHEPPDYCRGDGIISDDGTSHNLVQGNTIENCGHGTINMWGNYNIIRENIISYMECGVANPAASDGRQVMEDNIIKDIPWRGIMGIPRGGIFVNSPKSIIRRNIFSNLAGSGFVMFSDSNNSPSYSRIYHNVVYKAGQLGDDGFHKAVEFTEAVDGTMVGVVIKDNIFHDNYTDGTAWRDFANPSDHVVINNHWMADGDPLFKDEAHGDFHLIYGSPCIDRADLLTRTKQSGSGTELSVEDASYFIDGFGIVEGDLIQLEGQAQTARITRVDYTNNLITVDSPLTWLTGKGVSLAYSGSAPDMGAFEYDGPNPLTATMTASPTSGYTPLTVNFTGSASGGTPPYSYGWRFGDGQSSSEKSLPHVYANSGNYTAILTITDSLAAKANATVNITVTPTNISYSLSISSATGAPNSGQGGTTDPLPGKYSFSIGSTAQIRSMPYIDYRFFRWTGDVTESVAFNSDVALTMNNDKSISANFCTKCGDVSGDLRITPSDAQKAFDIYLGKISNPTSCEKENADVNCSGTKSELEVTPADAQAIFNNYLKKGELPSDCSGNSRKATVLTQSSASTNAKLTINNIPVASGQDILVPIIVESPGDISAFGFDLVFPSDVLSYVGMESTEMTKAYDQLEANIISHQTISLQKNETEAVQRQIFKLFGKETRESSRDFGQRAEHVVNYHVLRVGGYKTKATQNPSSGVLVTLIFRVLREAKEPSSLIIITATYDDIRNASIAHGMLAPTDRQNERPLSRSKRKSTTKSYDFREDE